MSFNSSAECVPQHFMHWLTLLGIGWQICFHNVMLQCEHGGDGVGGDGVGGCEMTMRNANEKMTEKCQC